MMPQRRQTTASAVAPAPPILPDVAIVLGTRPEWIKLAPLLTRLGSRAMVVSTGQHWDAAMDRSVLDGRPVGPTVPSCNIGGLTRAAGLATAIGRLEVLLSDAPVRAVVVQGDTTSALAGALAANAQDLPLVHVEAGLRSFDRRMPEEHNRVVIDHLADLNCCPNSRNEAQLLGEGICAERLAVTGNTVVESVTTMLPAAADRAALLEELCLSPRTYILATLHRPENVDDRVVLTQLLSELSSLSLPVVLPLHPRTAARIREHRLSEMLHPLHVTEPLSYPTFLTLFHAAALVISDSGGVQEEASVLKRPVLVVRRSTERPEIEGVFGALVDPRNGLSRAATTWLSPTKQQGLAALPTPYGGRDAGARVLSALEGLLQRT